MRTGVAEDSVADFGVDSLRDRSPRLGIEHRAAGPTHGL
jgi:hypothetical protein